MRSHPLTPQARRTTTVYLLLLVAVVLASRLGLFPGTGRAFEGQALLDHPYRLSMAVVALALAVYLGAWSAMLGRASGRWLLGLSALIVGGIVTLIAMSAMPWIYCPHDRYSPGFFYLLGGVPLAAGTWLVVTLAGLGRTPPR